MSKIIYFFYANLLLGVNNGESNLLLGANNGESNLLLGASGI